jgi:hypothetical protein
LPSTSPFSLASAQIEFGAGVPPIYILKLPSLVCKMALAGSKRKLNIMFIVTFNNILDVAPLFLSIPDVVQLSGLPLFTSSWDVEEMFR